MKTTLQKDEREILRSYEKGEWRSLGKKKTRPYVTAARRQLRQARVNIRLSSEVLEKIREDAHEEGIPYQTLISSVLYRYAHGRLHDEKHLLEAIRTLKAG